MTKPLKPEYIAKVKLLTQEEIERLLSRMGGKLPRRLEKRRVSQDEALAMQLELEDEQLQQWRKMMHSLKKKEEAKNKVKTKPAEKAKVVKKAKVADKAKVVKKAKVADKAKVVKKAKVADKAKAETSK
jgi:hypothetical protein